MSIKVFGVAELESKTVPLEEEIQDCFFIVEVATKNRLGIKLNVSNFDEKFKNFRGIIPIELTDNPLAENAENLFAGNGAKIHTDEVAVVSVKTLSARMMRVQNFLCEVLKVRCINKIILDINIKGEFEFETIEIKVHDFCAKMLELYERENNLTPTVRIVIYKK